jgi:glycosyltransferase involved in cell wall biosynthesis
LLVENASTDNTADVTRSCREGGPVPLRVINESRAGVRYARERGFAESNNEYLGFVDDDNWVAGDWVATRQLGVKELLRKLPSASPENSRLSEGLHKTTSRTGSPS